VIAHRQNVPESAELIAQMAGTTPRWIATEQTATAMLGTGHTGRGSRRRGYEFHVHPSRIKALITGQAVVLTPGAGEPVIARVNHPADAHAERRDRLAPIRALAGRLPSLRNAIHRPRRNP
jgi:hypothetical protein